MADHKRKILGCLVLDRRHLENLFLGMLLHFNPEFVDAAGWPPDVLIRTVEIACMVREESTNVQLTLRGWRIARMLRLDRDGYYVMGNDVPEIKQDGRGIPVFVAPLFLNASGFPLCPWCGKVSTYFQSVDYCPNRGQNEHGPIPDKNSPLFRPWPDRATPTWVTHGAVVT